MGWGCPAGLRDVEQAIALCPGVADPPIPINETVCPRTSHYRDSVFLFVAPNRARQQRRGGEDGLSDPPPKQKRSHLPLLLAAPPTAALGLGIVGLIIVIVIVVIIVTRVL